MWVHYIEGILFTLWDAHGEVEEGEVLSLFCRVILHDIDDFPSCFVFVLVPRTGVAVGAALWWGAHPGEGRGCQKFGQECEEPGLMTLSGMAPFCERLVSGLL